MQHALKFIGHERKSSPPFLLISLSLALGLINDGGTGQGGKRGNVHSRALEVQIQPKNGSAETHIVTSTYSSILAVLSGPGPLPLPQKLLPKIARGAPTANQRTVSLIVTGQMEGASLKWGAFHPSAQPAQLAILTLLLLAAWAACCGRPSKNLRPKQFNVTSSNEENSAIKTTTKTPVFSLKKLIFHRRMT
ncbi:hypothetical protein F5Y06DRAFT_249878 [Hypoxylon sp. FL0890]|nr:hypothetical protein F5Y06DRAFT_249878 [Hypoxylon sp. FL0890]